MVKYAKSFLHEEIIEEMRKDDYRFHASDNVSKYLDNGDIDILIGEAAEAFEAALKSLLIDTENDPNSKDTARRLAKMYFLEILSGRYTDKPDVTAFPNEGGEAYTGMIVIRADIKSICSHHHQPVVGTAYIGIIPNGQVLGLSKYIRLAQWHARRGTLQEELTKRIAEAISEETGAENVGVYIAATHGCCSNRGVMQDNSTTQTCYLKGSFLENSSVKLEFMDHIKLQQKS